MYIGPRSANKHVDMLEVEDYSGMRRDDWVAIHCSGYPGPCIAKVIEVQDESVNVVWYRGSYNSSWKLWEIPAARNKRKTQWEDTIPKSSILLFGFKMTPTNRLQKSTSQHLQTLYQTIELQDETESA